MNVHSKCWSELDIGRPGFPRITSLTMQIATVAQLFRSKDTGYKGSVGGLRAASVRRPDRVRRSEFRQNRRRLP